MDQQQRRQKSIEEVAKATHWSTDDVKHFMEVIGTEDDDGDGVAYAYAVAQTERVLELQERIRELEATITTPEGSGAQGS